jgi:hypothetical protein
MRRLLLLLVLSTALWACNKQKPVEGEVFFLNTVVIGSQSLSFYTPLSNEGLPLEEPLVLTFDQPVRPATVPAGVRLSAAGTPVPFSYTVQGAVVTLNTAPLVPRTAYVLSVSAALLSEGGAGCTPQEITFTTRSADLRVVQAAAGGQNLLASPPPRDVPLTFEARLRFSQPLQRATVSSVSVRLFRSGGFEDVQWTFDNGDSTLVLTTARPLAHFEKYTLVLTNAISGPPGYQLTGFNRSFYTALDPMPKFPVLSDADLIETVQRQTFKYFWDFGHPVSGLARERNTSGDIVTTGGSGFGLMAIIVGIERGFIGRSEGVARWRKVVSFLTHNAQRYHGAFAHWLNGSSGATVPFSTKDDGADLVETSFLMQGLLTVRQYLNPADPVENQLIADINALWEGVEWDWFTRGGQKVLYWHWSPRYGWEMNHAIRGYNECLITYFLAAASPTHAIAPEVYHQGWAGSGGIVNGNTYYGYRLPLGEARGGPLFFAHYSWLGLDPRRLEDQYAQYWTQNRHHTLINYAYCAANPLQKVGYSAQCWGLTASDNPTGYSAHSPNNDQGVITPTAALSSFPYTPTESMQALRFFYEQLGDKLWGPYGFYDAFSPQEGWYATSTLAIDQGPIIVMLENHRTGRLWSLFMSAPEVPTGAQRLGMRY